MTNNENLVGKKPDSLTVSRIINAPCDLVFKAWTEPERMVKWFSPIDIECRGVEADLKIGGAYRVQMAPKEGPRTAHGKYLRIIPNKQLQFTWSWKETDMPETMVTVDFEAIGEQTRLTLKQTGFVEPAETEGHTSGWTTAIEKFARLIEQGKINSYT